MGKKRINKVYDLMKVNFKGVDAEAETEICQNYRFRENIIKDIYEYSSVRIRNGKIKQQSEWIPVSESFINGVLSDLKKDEIKYSYSKMDAFIKNERISEVYDPFDDYFDGLPKWDGVDYIDELCKTIRAEEQQLFNKYFRKFLVSTVDCLLNDESGNDTALILQGGQGIGKSRWVRKLLPESFGREYIHEGILDSKNNDQAKKLSTCWFINLDEIGSLSEAKTNELKAFITQMSINFRPAYSKFTNHYVRRASFFGSTNDDSFLTDTTGNRRFLVFKILSMDYMHDVNMNGVWSQALHLLETGEIKGWLNPEEVAEVNSLNKVFTESTEEEQRILANFQFCSDDISKGEYLNSSDIKDKLMSIYPTVANRFKTLYIGRIMAKLCKEHNGHKKRDSIKGNVYKVNFIGIIPADEESTDKIFTSGTSTSFTKSTKPIAYQLPLNQSQLSDDDLPF